MASRELKHLTDEMQALALAFCERCKEQGLEVLIYCTFRTFDEQDALYASGRTKKGKILTNARAGESAHNFGKAFDCVPMIAGKPQWENEGLLNKMGEIGESIGLVWAGRWRGNLKEKVHFELSENT